MEHPTEFAIEQFILNAPEIRLQKAEIAGHLELCESCSALANEIRAFYEKTMEVLDHGIPPPSPTRSLITRRELHRRPDIDSITPVRSTPSPTFSGKLQTVARQHPIASGVSVTVVAALGILAGVLMLHRPVDGNPAYSSLDMKQGLVSFYNRENQVIFSAPWAIVNSSSMVQPIEEVLRRQIVIAHLPGTSRNIVVTSLSFGKRAWDGAPSAVRFIAGTGEELCSLPPPREKLTFRGRGYDLPMWAKPLAIAEGKSEDAPELFAEYDAGRSPTAIQRSDLHGNILGVYWHFGTLQIDTMRFTAGGEPLLLLSGLNDVDDYERFGLPVIIVVDPRLLNGESESSATRGFGLPTSIAERCYLALPIPDAATLISTRMMPTNVRRASAATFDAFVSGDANGISIGYDAILDTAFRVIEIKPNDALIDLHRNLVEAGKLRTPISDDYLRHLAAQARYWNGSEWSARASAVKHDPLR